MDPITGTLAVVGLGLSIFGGSEASDAAKRNAELSRQINTQEGLINDQKHQAMIISARRQQMEIIRNTQRARAMGLNAATSQGAQFGSGLAGGQAQASAQGGLNLQGIDQSLIQGDNIFAINNTISGLKSQMTEAQSDMASAQGLQSLGGSIMGAAGTVGKMTQGFGNTFSDPLGGFGGSSRWSIG